MYIIISIELQVDYWEQHALKDSNGFQNTPVQFAYWAGDQYQDLLPGSRLKGYTPPQ